MSNLSQELSFLICRDKEINIINEDSGAAAESRLLSSRDDGVRRYQIRGA